MLVLYLESTLFENANLAADQYDDAVGGVFHPQSLGLAMKADFSKSKLKEMLH
jgi:hypothetical protein